MAFPVRTEKDLIIVTSQDGEVTHADVIETLLLFANERESYQRKKLLIVDPSSDYNPSEKELQEFATILHSLLANVFLKVTLVAPRDLHYGLGRMAQALAGPLKGQFRVFREELEAREWLLT